MALAVGKAALYKFLGRHGYGEGLTIEEAIAELIDWWTRQPSLVMHEMGNLLVTLTMGSEKITFEITDISLLEDLRYEAPSKIYEGLGKILGIGEKDAQRLFDEMDHVSVEVGTIAVPGEPEDWLPTEGYEPDKVLEANRVALVKNYVDRGDLTDPTVLRTKEGKDAELWIYELGKEMGLSEKELLAAGLKKEAEVVQPKPKRKRKKSLGLPKITPPVKGGRYSDEDIKVIKKALKKAKGNASLVADELGIPDRTVRNIRQRLEEGRPTVKPIRKGAKKIGGKWSEGTQQFVVEFAKRPGESASSAGRRYGIPGRTVRGWMKKE